MRTFLDRLHDLKLNEVALRKNEISENNLRVKVETLGPGSDFRNCLLRKGNDPISLIAEVKSRAPGRKNVDVLIRKLWSMILKKEVQKLFLFLQMKAGLEALLKRSGK